MKRMNTSEIRKELAEALNQVAYAKERVVLHRRGKDVAALISIDDLNLLQALEDKIDNEAADIALQEPGLVIPWDEVKKELDLP
jgi:antitoxin Phd